MIRVGAVGQEERPASVTTEYDLRAEAAAQQPPIPRQRGAVDVSSAVRPPAA